MKKWYKRSTPNGKVYYTPFPQEKTFFHTAGDGSRQPTPSEVVKFLTEHPGARLEAGGYFKTHDVTGTDEEPVDLPPDAYRLGWSWERGEYLAPAKLRDDTYIGISTLYQPIASELKSFIEGKHSYKDDGMNVLARLGLLLCGPPGNGKTSLIREVMYREMPQDACALFMNHIPSPDFAEALNEGLGDRVKVVVFEELANMLEDISTREILDFMDGETSMDNTITIATTNYPQYLPKNLLERTSRFDLLFYLDNPSDEERKAFLSQFGKFEPTQADIDATFGMSIADLKEIVLSAKRRKETFPQAIIRLRERKNRVKEILARERELADAGRRY